MPFISKSRFEDPARGNVSIREGRIAWRQRVASASVLLELHLRRMAGQQRAQQKSNVKSSFLYKSPPRTIVRGACLQGLRGFCIYSLSSALRAGSVARLCCLVRCSLLLRASPVLGRRCRLLCRRFRERRPFLSKSIPCTWRPSFVRPACPAVVSRVSSLVF